MTQNETLHSDSARQNQKRAAIANLSSSVVLALQSVFMLWVISRVGTLEDAGVFTFGFANANLFLNMGRYGMRNFQVSDAVGTYSFKTYFKSRLITVGAMLAFGSLYALVAGTVIGYQPAKIMAIILLCLFKAQDALEDVFHGNYQQNGRLDLAGVLLSLRLLLTMAVFAVAMTGTRNLNTAISLSCLSSIVFIVFESYFVWLRFSLPRNPTAAQSLAAIRHNSTFLILKECFPLFVAAFSSFLIGNSPKYAIDAIQGDATQALFGYLSMPVFTVNLLASSVYQPQVSQLAQLWVHGERARCVRTFVRQLCVTAVIALGCTVLVYMCGAQVLGFLYDIDLSAYKFDLAILMLGGGCYAMVVLMLIGITIIRAQDNVAVGYLIVTVISLMLSWALVGTWGITGASCGYLFAMLLQCLVFGSLLFSKVFGAN